MASTKARRSATLHSAVLLGSLASTLAGAAAAQTAAQTAPSTYGPVVNAPPGGPAPNNPPGAPAPTPAPAPVGAPTPTPVQPSSIAAPAPLPAPAPAPAPVPAAPLAPPPTIYPTPAPTPQPAPATLPPPAAAAPPSTVYPPQPAAAAPADYAPEEPRRDSDDDDDSNCLMREFCIGPALTGGVLNVFGIGVHARMDYWGLGFDYQFIDLGYRDVDGSLGLVTLEGRVYPGGGAFFFTAGVQWQSIGFETPVTVTVEGISQRVMVQGSTVIPLFKLGFGFMGRDGFVMGIDLALGFRLSKVAVDLTTDVDDLLVEAGLDTLPQVVEARAQFRQAAEEWIEYLPFTVQFNILRIGYLF